MCIRDRAYGPAIMEAIDSKDLSKMNAALKLAEQNIKDHGDLVLSYIKLQEAIRNHKDHKG